MRRGYITDDKALERCHHTEDFNRLCGRAASGDPEMPTSYAYKVPDREGKMAAGSMEAEKGAGLKIEVRVRHGHRVAAMLIFIVPTVENLYASLGGTLPLPTRMLMGASRLLVAVKSIYTDKQDYGQAIETASADPLEAVEPTLNYVVTGTASTGPNEISTGTSGTGTWHGAVKSDASATTSATGTTCTATAAGSATFGSKW